MTRDIIAERTLDYSDGQATKPVTVRIHRPYQRPTGEWACLLEIIGPRAMKHEFAGEDSAQALLEALWIIGTHIEGYDPPVTWHGSKPWVSIDRG